MPISSTSAATQIGVKMSGKCPRRTLDERLEDPIPGRTSRLVARASQVRPASDTRHGRRCRCYTRPAVPRSVPMEPRARSPRGMEETVRALLSVANRDGIADLARDLAALGVELFATDGTREALAEDGVEVQPVSA